jgi:hypothetical protein
VPPTPADKITDRRHPEWVAHRTRWRWLLDSLEGGAAYRDAIYEYDLRGYPVRNLVRHKREYPEPSSQPVLNPVYTGDPGASAGLDDYEMRRQRTPVPTFLAECVEVHLSKIYEREIERETPVPAVEAWWADADGKGTPVDRWMAETVAPLLMTLGQLDLVFDRPPAPEGESVETMADVQRLGLDRVVASYVLPENMVWWRLDRMDRYVECLVLEAVEDGKPNLRHWTEAGWTLFDHDGNTLGQGTHPYGVVPIVRVFDRRRPRCRNVGLPRYEAVAELQREFYNRDSELILSDSVQAHPLVQGPEDILQTDGSLPIGPAWMLPKKKSRDGNSYEGFDVLDFPKGAAESIRSNMQGLRDRIDRAALLTKPAGARGTDGNTVSQSGVSKRLDRTDGDALLAKIAATLEDAEKAAARMAGVVAGVEVDPETTTVAYPRDFDLWAPDELAVAVADFQTVVMNAGALPEVEEALLCRLARLMLPGLSDAEYGEFDAEIETYLAATAATFREPQTPPTDGEPGAQAGEMNADGGPDEQQPDPAAESDGEPVDA